MATLNELKSNSTSVGKKSASGSEAGHARNVANFGKLVSFCTGYGAGYNPVKATLVLNALTVMQTDSQNLVNAVNDALPAFNNALAARENTFKPLSKLITRVMNALKASDTTAETNAKVQTLVRKLQGRRASAKLTDEEKTALEEQGKKKKEVSSSQFSYDNRLDTFDKLIKLLASIPQYAPNETDLAVSSLKALLTVLIAKNSAVILATTPLSNSRILRNDIIYRKKTGLIDVALDVKSYVKSVFGTDSPQYKQISELGFKRYKA